MNIEFDEWGWWNTAVRAVRLFGKMDGRPVRLAFAGRDLSELFGVPYEPLRVESAFMHNQKFMESIARDLLLAGRLEDDGTMYIEKDVLLPYFEKRAATAPA